jgi:hypothetical protein
VQKLMARRRQENHTAFRPVYHPAGLDTELAKAVNDVRIGHWVGMRDLLSSTGSRWAIRTSRTQTLASVAAGTTVVDAWCAEEPDNADAAVMYARVSVERALHAHRKRHGSRHRLENSARDACSRAAKATPDDPVPWVGLVALSQADEHPLRPEHRVDPPEPMLPLGPWGLLHEVCRRDPFSREGFHRAMQFLLVAGYRAHAFDFTRWVASWTPVGSPLLVMPLYAYAEHYWHRRSHGERDTLLNRQWAHEDALPQILKALDDWFRLSEPTTRSVLDLNYLAHALWAAHHYKEAAEVFAALGPCATRLPWAYVSGGGPDRADLAEQEFVRARAQCLAQSPGADA